MRGKSRVTEDIKIMMKEIRMALEADVNFKVVKTCQEISEECKGAR